jgi:anti-sigma factor ChrR (cupin superfamily)
MQLHTDCNQRVVINTEKLSWLDSPIASIQRQMLERDEKEVARASSIVRYAANSHFFAHTHGGGEEFLVLEGVFSDEYGDYPSGTYIRNPPGSSHAPYSQQGCKIFVKLRQMDQQDQERVVINTQQTPWLQGLVAGLQVMPLHNFGTEQVALVKWAAGTKFQRHLHWGGEEILVLEGTLADEQGIYPQGTWLRNPPEEVPEKKVGTMTLKRIPENFFQETEQSAFSPSNMIAGIEPSEDRMLQGRLFSYADTHRHRLGVNNQILPINRPHIKVVNGNQDGLGNV